MYRDDCDRASTLRREPAPFSLCRLGAKRPYPFARIAEVDIANDFARRVSLKPDVFRLAAVIPDAAENIVAFGLPETEAARRIS